MKCFFDTEFLEGTQKTWFGKSKPTIDLISIGIVSEGNRQYYAISKDFNLKEAWNRYDIIEHARNVDNGGLEAYIDTIPEKRLYWIRENVLKPIFNEWKMESNGKIVRLGLPTPLNEMEFNYKNFKYCIKCIGKTNTQIAEEIQSFVYYTGWEVDPPIHAQKLKENGSIEFYAYFADYDWVVFCWLFGSMMNLPKGFPKCCIDLKQDLDRIANNKAWYYHEHILSSISYDKDRPATFEEKLNRLKAHQDYPQQVNEHNALADAKWNKELFEFLNKI